MTPTSKPSRSSSPPPAGEILRGMNAIHGLRAKLVRLQGQGDLDPDRLEATLIGIAETIGEDVPQPERRYPPFEALPLKAAGPAPPHAGAGRDPERMAQIRQVGARPPLYRAQG